MNMNVFSIALLVIISPALQAESLQNEYATQVVRATAAAVVDMKIDATCVKQVTPTGQTIIKNSLECSDALNKIENSLGKTEDEAELKLKISRFKNQYNLR